MIIAIETSGKVLQRRSTEKMNTIGNISEKRVTDRTEKLNHMRERIIEISNQIKENIIQIPYCTPEDEGFCYLSVFDNDKTRENILELQITAGLMKEYPIAEEFVILSYFLKYINYDIPYDLVEDERSYHLTRNTTISKTNAYDLLVNHKEHSLHHILRHMKWSNKYLGGKRPQPHTKEIDDEEDRTQLLQLPSFLLSLSIQAGASPIFTELIPSIVTRSGKEDEVMISPYQLYPIESSSNRERAMMIPLIIWDCQNVLCLTAKALYKRIYLLKRGNVQIYGIKFSLTEMNIIQYQVRGFILE